MQKKMLAAAIAAMITLSTGSVFANPVELDGSVSYQFRKDTTDSQGDATGGKFTAVINGKTNLDRNLDLYARLGAQTTSEEAIRDFTKNADSDAAIDQFGFLYNNKGFNYKLGRQDATIGSTALLYNNNYKVGHNAFVDGLSVSGTSGVTALNAIIAEEDNNGDDNQIASLNASFSPSANLILGATVAKYDYNNSAVKDTNHFAVNAAYDFGKALAFAEYAKSDVDNDNKAFDIGVKYNLDGKNTAGIAYARVEKNGDMNGMTDFDNNQKAVYYTFSHKVNDKSSIDLFYKAGKIIEDAGLAQAGDKNDSFRATMNYNF
ncbi:hypothetical protein SDC9_115585 [bioreactor metagenome]|uniref:Porin domain-containing protein n=1 Tax=bioreactor metagenome TaxID=1076179 RepID=A0A645BVN0_9ZZZZ